MAKEHQPGPVCKPRGGPFVSLDVAIMRRDRDLSVHIEAHDVGERLSVAGTARVHHSQEGLPCSLAVEAETSSRRTVAGRDARS